MIKAIKLYYKIMPLKNLLRSGFIFWGANAERIESVAEHSWSCCLLALTIQKETKAKLNLEKILKMLVIHEFEEVYIGDLTPFDKQDKQVATAKARDFFVNDLKLDKEFLSLIDEFNESKTKEARFCKMIDRLDATLMTKYYEDKGQLSITSIKNSPEKLRSICEKESLKDKLQSNCDVSDLFYFYSQDLLSEFGIDEKMWFKKIKKIKTK